MLLPALSKVREKAKSISCISKMKQLGTAYSMYLLDYGQPVQALVVDENNFKYAWSWHLRSYFGITLRLAEQSDFALKYIKQHKGKTIYECPAISNMESDCPTYKINLHTFNNLHHEIEGRWYKNRSSTIIFIDGQYDSADIWRRTRVWGDGAYGHAWGIHGGFNNLTCWDGHVESLRAIPYTSGGETRKGCIGLYKPYEMYWF